MALDLVCGMDLDASGAVEIVEFEGRELPFCSKDCANTFRASPASFTGPGDHPVKDAVCGMELHPTPQAPSVAFRGTTYIFCSEQCHWRFTTSPRFFVDQPEVA